MSESTCQSAVGDKSSELKKVANWWVSETSLQFDSDLESKEEQAFQHGVIGAKRVKAISMLEWERELRGRGPLPAFGNLPFALFLYQGQTGRARLVGA